MTIKVMYKGPAVHRRIIRLQDLRDAEVENLPEKMPDLVWEPEPDRKSVDISEHGEGVLEFFKESKAFTVKEDDKVVSRADSNAGVVAPDGSSGDVPPDPAAAKQRRSR